MPSYAEYPDELLFQYIQEKDDEAAFAELYNRYWDKLIVRALTRLHSPQDAEDILHDVFVSIWNRRKKIFLRHGFHTYIAAILKYEIIHKLADRKSLQIVQEEQQVQPPDDSTLLYLQFHDLQQRLEQSVRQLPGKCQLVFRLSREKGLKEKEIARMLQLSPKTVENHIHHALRALRSALNDFLSFLL